MRPIGATSDGTGRRSWACSTYFLRDLEQIVFPQPRSSMRFRRWTARSARTIGWTAPPDRRADSRRRRCRRRRRRRDLCLRRQAGAASVRRRLRDALASSPSSTERRRPGLSPRWAAAGLRGRPRPGRGRSGGRQTWLNQVDDQPLHCLTSVAAARRRHHLRDRRQRGTIARGLVPRSHGRRTSSAALVACGAGLERATGAAARPALSLWARGLAEDASLVHRELEPPGQPRPDRWHAASAPRTVIGNLPGYPARLGPRRGRRLLAGARSRCARISSSSCCARTISARR